MHTHAYVATILRLAIVNYLLFSYLLLGIYEIVVLYIASYLVM